MVRPRACGISGQHDPAGDLPGDALGDQHLEVLHDRRDFQQERENHQRQQERRDDFPDDVAINRSQHRGLHAHYGRSSAAERKNQPVT